MLDDFGYPDDTNTNPSAMIAPFWTYFSQKLTTLFDPVHGEYNPLPLNIEYWTDIATQYKFVDSVNDMVAELAMVTMKYATIKELLHHSNGDALNPVFAYSKESVLNKQAEPTRSDIQDYSEMCADLVDENVGEGFWFSDEYLYGSANDDTEEEGKIEFMYAEDLITPHA